MEGGSVNTDELHYVVRDSRKRVSDFLSMCTVVKKRKVDLERQIISKRSERRRIDENICRLKVQIAALTQKLSAKEAVLDSIDMQIEMLLAEHGDAIE